MRDLVLFLEKFDVNPETGCWEWNDALTRTGYGNYRLKLAHRLAYKLWIGPIPEGLHLDHLCRNRRCINPDHLEPVTCRINILRGEGIAARNSRKTHCPRGHAYDVVAKNGSRRCRTCKNAQGRQYYKNMTPEARQRFVEYHRKWERKTQRKKKWWAALDAAGRAKHAADALKRYHQKRASI